MPESITETLKKINTELRGMGFISLSGTLIILSLFMLFKIASSPYFNQKESFSFISSPFQNSQTKEKDDYFIYASKKRDQILFLQL